MDLTHHRRPLRGAAASGSSRRHREGGYVLTLFGLLLVPLLLMAGLAVDVGYWYNRASDIQKAADAASLAGVVWLPNAAVAQDVARDVAARNGFDYTKPGITVTATPSAKAPRRLKVTITDDRVGSFFYKNLGGSNIGLTRTSFAEYVTPVPMGSPRNFFGLGTLNGTGFDREFLYQSVNPFCTDKVNGDRYQSQTFGGTCSGTMNTEYRDTGYEMYIEAPATRTAGIEVRLFDPRYNEDAQNFVITNPPVCTTTDTLTYPTSTTSGWTGPVAGNTSNLTIAGPVQYQTHDGSGVWSAVQERVAGQTITFRRDRLRYRSPAFTWPASNTTGWTGPGGTTTSLTISGLVQYQTRADTNAGTAWLPATPTVLPTGSTFALATNRLRYRSPIYTMTPVTTCVPSTTTISEPAIDDERNDNARERYTYTLFSADDTPLNDDDNPVLCEKFFDFDAAFDGYQYLGSRRWNTLCTIPATGPSGKYILRVHNSGAVSNPTADGSNQWGLVARYNDASAAGLCDGRVDANCPRVYGKDAISVKADASTAEASFFLAEIGPEHTGKKLRLELFDPGEGGDNLQIMLPTGTNTWAPVPFSWKVGTSAPQTTSQLSVLNSAFNGKLVEITVDLSGYAPPINNNWWQIKYAFTSGAAVTDRTTWSAKILGDPVHLIEEN